MKDPILISLSIQGIQEKDLVWEYFPMKKNGKFFTITKNRLYNFMIIYNIVKYTEIHSLIIEFYDFRKEEFRYLNSIIDAKDSVCKFSEEQLKNNQYDLYNLIIRISLMMTYDSVRQIHQDISTLKNSFQNLSTDNSKCLSQLEDQRNLVSKLIKQPQPSPQKKYQEQLQIAILYSNPLIRMDSNQLPQAISSVGYYKEFIDIRNSIETAEKKINYLITQATPENLRNVLSKDPILVHIISHGDHEEGVFYLAFEDKGQMFAMKQKDLRTIFQEHTKRYQNLQLVILSCCHSGEIAKALQESSVPFVIAVSSEYKIEDEASIVYSRNLYHYLLLSNELQKSHEQALQAIKDKQQEKVYTCCCAHQHNNNCQFDIIRVNGVDCGSMHEWHTPTCTCEFRQELYHIWGKKRCDWAQKFLAKLYNEKYGQNAEDPLNDEVAEILQNHTQIREKKEYLKVCCCEIANRLENYEDKELELVDVQHDESKKFQIFTQKEKSQIIFKRLESGDRKLLSSTMIEDINILGREVQAFELYQKLLQMSNERIFIVGKPGSGKTTLIEQTIVYYMERNSHFSNHRKQLLQPVYQLKEVENEFDFFEIFGVFQRQDSRLSDNSSCSSSSRLGDSTHRHTLIQQIIDKAETNYKECQYGKAIYVFEDADNVINKIFFNDLVKQLLKYAIVIISLQEQSYNTAEKKYGSFKIELKQLNLYQSFQFLYKNLALYTTIGEQDFEKIEKEIELYPKSLKEIVDFTKSYIQNERGDSKKSRFSGYLDKYLKQLK